MNCGERSACPAVIPSPPSAGMPGDEAVISGGRRTSSAAGTSSTHAPMAMVNIAVRQS